MTGLLPQMAATEHVHELRAAAGKRDQPSRGQHSKRVPRVLAVLHRPRRALAA